jgi:hypothetical protein
MDGVQGSLADGRCGIDRGQKTSIIGGSWAADRKLKSLTRGRRRVQLTISAFVDLRVTSGTAE